MQEFQKVTNTESEEFKAAIEIYTEAFPLNEQQPLHIVKDRIESGRSELYIGRAEGEIVFMAMLFPLKNTDFILLDYMATLHTHRGKSAGSFFLKHISEILKTSNKYFLIESENPESENNKAERERRIAFYRRNGAKLLQDVRHILPGMHGLQPTEMVLLMMPEYADKTMEGSLVHRLITQVYAELYNRYDGDALLQACLDSIPEYVKII